MPWVYKESDGRGENRVVVVLVSPSEEEGEGVCVVDSAKVKWSSCVRRQAEEQKAVPLVCRSQDKQKSPSRKSMFSGLFVRLGPGCSEYLSSSSVLKMQEEWFGSSSSWGGQFICA